MSAMRLALGLSVHTGWAAAVVAGGDWENPVVVLRERLEVLAASQRFVFHKAAEMKPDEARSWLRHARIAALERASAVMRRLRSRARDVERRAVTSGCSLRIASSSSRTTFTYASFPTHSTKRHAP
jgi:hypothetical protein